LLLVENEAAGVGLGAAGDEIEGRSSSPAPFGPDDGAQFAFIEIEAQIGDRLEAAELFVQPLGGEEEGAGRERGFDQHEKGTTVFLDDVGRDWREAAKPARRSFPDLLPPIHPFSFFLK